MSDYERAFEIAGTGVGVVFVALVILTLVTLLLTRFLEEKNNDEGPQKPYADHDLSDIRATTSESTDEDDSAAIAAMVAAIQVVRGSISHAVSVALPSSDAPTVGTWRSQGRQTLMQSQGVSSTPRTRKR